MVQKIGTHNFNRYSKGRLNTLAFTTIFLFGCIHKNVVVDMQETIAMVGKCALESIKSISIAKLCLL